MPNERDRTISIKCSAKDAKEKKEIQSIFKKNHISMAGYVMDKLREKADRLRSEA